jgi:hypothetical protein
MPYKDKLKDRNWHRDYMRKCRSESKIGVTIKNYGVVTPKQEDNYIGTRCDADGSAIYDMYDD